MPRLWLEYCLGWCGDHYCLVSLPPALFVFTVGFVLAVTSGFASVYLDTSAIYLGTAGIGWVSAWTYWAVRRLRQLMLSVRPAFDVPEWHFSEIVSRWQRRFFWNRLYVTGSLLVALIAFVFVRSRMITRDLPWFPSAWCEPPLTSKFAIIALFCVGVSLLVFTAGAEIIVYSWFVTVLSRQPLVPVVDFSRAKLRSLADFGVKTGFAWSGGVSLFVLLFRPAFGPFSVGGVLLLSGLAVVLLSAPQFALHAALEHSKNRVLDAEWRRLVNTETDGVTSSLERLSTADRAQLYETLSTLAESPTWVYNPPQVFSVGGTWLLPLLPLAADWLWRHKA